MSTKVISEETNASRKQRIVREDDNARIERINRNPRRYVADWIAENDDVEGGAISRSFHADFASAKEAAIHNSKKAGVVEWVRVREQEQQDGRWVTVAKWTGDYSALEEVPL